MDISSRLIIVCGHYGTGKTNFSINLAADFRRRGEDVTLVDLDIVNPYFRSSDYSAVLDDLGVKLISPAYAHSNLDLPALPAEIYSIFSNTSGRVIIDVGGDDQGATALGRFSKKIIETGDYSMIYIVNKYRPMTAQAIDTAQIFREIEAASKLSATAVFNNSHLMGSTTAQVIADSADYADEISKALGVPLIGTAVPRGIIGSMPQNFMNIYPIDIYIKPPWETA